MLDKTQSRKWQITLNNPVDKGFTHENIKNILTEFKSLLYWCMSDETAKTGTAHTHVYFVCSGGVRFDSLKSRFSGGHFEIARGTSQENRDYIYKEGKWADNEKGETNIRESHEEFGEMPVERSGVRNDIIDLYDMVKNGMSNYEIFEINPSYAMRVDTIDKMRRAFEEEVYKTSYRLLHVTYISGATGLGKTRGVMEQYGYDKVYRVTDYDHPFDNYNGQDVILFDEFRSSLKIQDMLNYLDGYPLQLPCRYNNRFACYTQVYIVSNIPLEDQYRLLQGEQGKTWQAFLRRINKVTVYEQFENVTYEDVRSYLTRHNWADKPVNSII